MNVKTLTNITSLKNEVKFITIPISDHKVMMIPIVADPCINKLYKSNSSSHMEMMLVVKAKVNTEISILMMTF